MATVACQTKYEGHKANNCILVPFVRVGKSPCYATTPASISLGNACFSSMAAEANKIAEARNRTSLLRTPPLRVHLQVGIGVFLVEDNRRYKKAHSVALPCRGKRNEFPSTRKPFAASSSGTTPAELRRPWYNRDSSLRTE
jgi:hypothetical protein